MGGLNAGEVAAGLAVEEVLNALPAGFYRTDAAARKQLSQAVRSANRAVYKRSKSAAGYTMMGTTLVVLVCCGADEVLIANVGDSRCYQFTNSQLVQTSVDHSLVQ
jgi:protein phosphatase